MSQIKPLKTNFDHGVPQQTDPVNDQVTYKDLTSTDGIFYFGNSGQYAAELVGGVVKLTIPDCSMVPMYLANGEIDSVQWYSDPGLAIAKRILSVQMAYDASLNPTTETWRFYNTADGATVVRTITITHTWSGVDLVQSDEVTT